MKEATYIIKRTISGIIGKGDTYHNNRKIITENVDTHRISDNIIIKQDDIKSVYHELFDKALIEYNSKQKRGDRVIKNYHEHLRHSRQEKEFHEVIFQIGNCEDTAVGSETAKIAAEILKQFAVDFENRNPHIKVFNSVIHLDEATPHLHIDFVPFATEQKRGLSTRVSLSKALEQQGFISEGKFNTCSKLWIDTEKKHLSELMLSRGIEWEQLGTENENLSVLNYKKQQRQKEVSALEKDISKYADKKSKIKSVEDISTKKALIGDKITLSQEDYNNISSLAKKQIASEKTEKKLKSEITTLKAEKSALIFENEQLKGKIKDSNSINLRLENAKLKEKISALENMIDKVEQFLKTMGLYEKFQQFIFSKSHERQKNKGELE